MERKQDFTWLKNWRVLIACGTCLFAGFLIGLLIFGSPWHLPPAWGDIPTWITAIATAGLLVGAIITARYAIKAFGKQAEEVAILVEDAKRQAAERRQAQAARVFSVVPYDPPRLISPYAENASEFPVFDAQLWYSGADGPTGPDDLGAIMPRKTARTTRAHPYRNVKGHTILTFRDAAGVRWVRLRPVTGPVLKGTADAVPARHTVSPHLCPRLRSRTAVGFGGPNRVVPGGGEWAEEPIPLTWQADTTTPNQ